MKSAKRKASTQDAPVQEQPQGKTFYKRDLPSPPAIAFSSAEGKKLFSEALAAGTMEGFFPLIEQFSTQDEPAYCGLASLAMVMNTLQIDPRRKWKGPWRWFHEEMLDCCKPLAAVVEEGITLDQASCIARCNGAKTDMVRHSQIGLAEFRQDVERCCSLPNEHIIVSYSRKAFLQTGDGHFSPVGGWHAASQHVLILDVARFKYSPHWVPLALLYQAMKPPDPATTKCRGYLKMGSHLRPSSILFYLNLQCSAWSEASAFLERIPELLDHASSPTEGITALVGAAPMEAIEEVVGVRPEDLSCSPSTGTCVQEDAVHQLLEELDTLELFKLIEKHARFQSQRDPHDNKFPYNARAHAELLCMFLLMAALQHPLEVPEVLKIDASRQILLAEVQYMASQFVEMPALLGTAASQEKQAACCATGCA